MPDERGRPVLEDLSVRERMRALLPATAAMLAIIALACAALALWVEQQRDTDRRAFQHEIALRHNGIICTFRPYVLAAKARAELNSKPRNEPNAQKRALARQAVHSSNVVLAGLVTIPPLYKCPKVRG
jgi:hypothetical protein